MWGTCALASPPAPLGRAFTPKHNALVLRARLLQGELLSTANMPSRMPRFPGPMFLGRAKFPFHPPTRLTSRRISSLLPNHSDVCSTSLPPARTACGRPTARSRDSAFGCISPLPPPFHFHTLGERASTFYRSLSGVVAHPHTRRGRPASRPFPPLHLRPRGGHLRRDPETRAKAARSIGSPSRTNLCSSAKQMEGR